MEPVEAVLARELSGREVTGIVPAARGNHKRTFLIDFANADGVVVQLSSRPDALRTEITLARAVSERTSVPVPPTLTEGTLGGDGYVISERALGTDLHERFADLSPDEQANVAWAFGRWLAGCHETFTFDGWGRLVLDEGRLVASEPEPRAWFDSYLAAGLDALPASLADLRPDIEAATGSSTPEPPARLFPWDLRPGNALYDDSVGVTAVLDWGAPLAASPGLSAAKTEHLVCDWYIDNSGLPRRAFRAGYRDRRPWPEPSLAERVTAVVRSAVDSRGTVTRPGYPERTGDAAVRFHRDRLVSLLSSRDV